MTNPTTPLPVQEPAGVVEAIMALADAYAEAAQRGEDAMSIARKCSALRSALASLPPVTQAKSEAVAVVQRGAQTPWGFAGVLVSWEPGLQDLPPGKHPLYAAPQEAVERQPLTGWQPIETAPKGGPILLIDMTASHPAVQWGCFRLTEGPYKWSWRIINDTTNIVLDPTHWMPLPPAPDRGLRIAEKGDARAIISAEPWLKSDEVRDRLEDGK